MSNERRAQELADSLRDKHGLGDAPIKDLFEFVHTAEDIDVLSMDAGEAEHGLSMLYPATSRAAIAVATTPHPMRQRSSIAHELGHVLGGDLERPGESLVPGERSPAETRADAFARHLLLPLSAVRRHFQGASGPVTEKDLSHLVQEYGVSPALAAIQLRTANLIDQAQCSRWTSHLTTRFLATSYGWLNQYDALAADSQRARAPQGLMARAVDGYRRGVLGVAELAIWYGQDPEDLATELGPPTNDDAHEEDWDDDEPLFPSDYTGPAS